MNMAKNKQINAIPAIAIVILLLTAITTFTIGKKASGFYDNLMPNLFTLSIEGMLFVVVFEYYKEYEQAKQNKKVIALVASHFGHLFIILNAFKNFTDKSEHSSIETNYIKLIDWSLQNYKIIPFDDIQRECINILETKNLLIGLVSQLSKNDLLATTTVIRNLEAIAKAKNMKEVENDCWLFLTFLKGVVSGI